MIGNELHSGVGLWMLDISHKTVFALCSIYRIKQSLLLDISYKTVFVGIVCQLTTWYSCPGMLSP